MGKTDCFTQFYPILPNWFYPLGKTYMPTLYIVSEKSCGNIIKIGQRLVKLLQNIKWHFFLIHGVYIVVLNTVNSIFPPKLTSYMVLFPSAVIKSSISVWYK